MRNLTPVATGPRKDERDERRIEQLSGKFTFRGAEAPP
jgi:hypothetical protein